MFNLIIWLSDKELEITSCKCGLYSGSGTGACKCGWPSGAGKKVK